MSTAATPLSTLLLDQSAWDLVLDSMGNIALAAPPYALAQDVASAQRTFLAELWYDITQGIPYFQQILGRLPPTSIITQLMSNEAKLRVPGVVTAQTVISAFTADGEVDGQTQFTDSTGETTVVTF